MKITLGYIYAHGSYNKCVVITKRNGGLRQSDGIVKKCKMFETDEMISRRDKESIKDSLGIKSDEEYEKLFRSASIDDIKTNCYRNIYDSVHNPNILSVSRV
jgi:hypothetical protein